MQAREQEGQCCPQVISKCTSKCLGRDTQPTNSIAESQVRRPFLGGTVPRFAFKTNSYILPIGTGVTGVPSPMEIKKKKNTWRKRNLWGWAWWHAFLLALGRLRQESLCELQSETLPRVGGVSSDASEFCFDLMLLAS